MTKDYAKKQKLKNKKTRSSGARLGRHVAASSGRSLFLALLLVTLASFFCGIALFAYYYKHHTIPSYFSKVKDWLNIKHTASQNSLEKIHQEAKRVVTNKNAEEQPIHFEFYQALPNMQVTVPSAIINNDMQSTLDRVKNPVSNQVSTEVATKPINVEEIERDLAKQFQQNYIIQLGVFHTFDAAKRYQKFLSHSGFSAKINKIFLADKPLFRVEQGPFLSKAQVKIAQLRLQQKGLKSFILTK